MVSVFWSIHHIRLAQVNSDVTHRGFGFSRRALMGPPYHCVHTLRCWASRQDPIKLEALSPSYRVEAEF